MKLNRACVQVSRTLCRPDIWFRSVDDLLNFINKEADQKEGAHKRAKRPPQPIYQRFRASVSSKPPLVNETTDSPDSVSSEADSETETEELVSSQEGVTSSDEEGDVIAEVAAPERLAVSVPEEDDGEWQVGVRFWVGLLLSL
jgi:hypothetical protein